MSKFYTAGQVATFLGMSRSNLFRELRTLPYTTDGLEITFSEEQFQETRRILDADPSEQLERLVALDHMQRQTAKDDEEETRASAPKDCAPWCAEHLDGGFCTSTGAKFNAVSHRPMTIEIYAQQDPELPTHLMCVWGNEVTSLTPAEAARVGQSLLDYAALLGGPKYHA